MIAIGLSGKQDEPIAISTKNHDFFVTIEQAKLIALQLIQIVEFVKKHENEDKS